MSLLINFKRKLGIRLLRKYRSRLSKKPLDGALHYDFAVSATGFGLYNLANAEIKSAVYLGFDDSAVAGLNKSIEDSLSDVTELDVNQYQRFVIMQAHLSKLLKPGDSILDIGGGHGILSQFMPDNRYFLIEPSVNGISGLKLPFSDNSFDAVVTCHVLEHIEEDKRTLFIDELVRVSKKSVLLFNPFKNDELDEMERMQLILDITNASWAREHMECGLPRIEEITDYLSSQGLAYSIKEYGDIYASAATVFMSYFAGKKNQNDLVRINQHLNKKYNQMGASEYPTNIMIEITRDNSAG